MAAAAAAAAAAEPIYRPAEVESWPFRLPEKLLFASRILFGSALALAPVCKLNLSANVYFASCLM